MRISTTTLEAYRLWRAGEWMDEADLIATIEHKVPLTDPRVLLGTAFDSVITDPDRYGLVFGLGYECDGYTFTPDVMEPALALFDRRGIFQAKASKRYGPHEVVAKADYLIGTQLHENKTTVGSFDMEKYCDSYQWRFMADIFAPNRITYNVFLLSADESSGYRDDIRLRGIERFDVYPYERLRDDCEQLVTEFAHYVTMKGLAPFLDGRQRAAEDD